MTDTFAMIAVQRRAVADVLASLDDGQWATPSLCAGWTVREVTGHLITAFKVSKTSFLLRMALAGGSFDKVADYYARALAAAPTATLVDTLRANAGHHFTPPGFGPEAPLTDAVTHGLDIGIPVGHRPPVPAGHANIVLGFLMTAKATRGFVARGRVAGLRFETSDTGWSAGSGPAVTGPAESLILALTGRRIGLDGLGGEGAAELASRLG